MKIICLTVGKKHDIKIAAAIEEYQKRLTAYTDFSFDYVNTSDKETESSEILRRIKHDDVVILLDEKGRSLNNQSLEDMFARFKNESIKRIVVIIGGPYGVTSEVQARSDSTYSLSGLVFPHQIVRLLLVEQLYRTFNKMAGGKYHHS